ARTSDQLDELARNHLLLLRVPLLALAVDVDPHAKALLVLECRLSDLGGQRTVLRLFLLDEDLRVGPTAIAVDDAELRRQRRVRLKQQRLEDALVRLDLALQLRILFRADA